MNNIKSECYALIQEIVVSRDKLCKGPGCMNYSTSGHHIFRRNMPGTAFNVRYVIGLCQECHDYMQWHPALCRQWAEHLLGHDDYEYGRKMSEMIIKHINYKVVRDELIKLRDYYKIREC